MQLRQVLQRKTIWGNKRIYKRGSDLIEDIRKFFPEHRIEEQKYEGFV